jgi:hypothetical protein
LTVKEKKMETKALRIRNVIFWALVVYFAAIVAEGANKWRVFGGQRMPLWGFALVAIVLCALSAALVVLTLKLKDPLIQRIFFLMTGLSALALPVFAILHNLVYGLFFHGKAGEDEAVFFILAVIVCPALFVIGMLGSIVILVSDRFRKKNIAC